ncbi:uncharacterized protein LOC118270903 [Spodoptera frugiperda]|uniref:Uncharacterized protein LOC118270903 n=1 Tax=Spodoptera frugiperda TaxID=7108 RepID=A0A9R0D6Z4_SPOFR|nr:uncharacterized protein LOC118270903 [Spodoptera frugiperda]WKR38900.1 odorant binding protein 19 [Spodoptera frugiperda]
MFRRALLFLSVIYSLQYCNGQTEAPEKNRMMGIDAVHDNNVKIDKDTIITRNLKLEKRNRGPKSDSNKNVDEKEPDWSYASFPKEISEHVENFKKNMSECLKEVQSSDKRPVKRLSPKMESPVHGECLIACVLKRNGVIIHGKVNKDNLIALVSKFYSKDTRLMKKLEKNLDRCIEMSVRAQDDCTLASLLNDCTNDLMASNKHKLTVNY